MSETTLVSAPVFDPFHYRVELPLEVRVNAHGFPMRVITNSARVIQTTEESWTGYPQLFTDHSLEFRFMVSDDEQARRPSDVFTRAQKHLLVTVSDEQD